MSLDKRERSSGSGSSSATVSSGHHSIHRRSISVDDLIVEQAGERWRCPVCTLRGRHDGIDEDECLRSKPMGDGGEKRTGA